jgi:hypothetical protein
MMILEERADLGNRPEGWSLDFKPGLTFEANSKRDHGEVSWYLSDMSRDYLNILSLK